MFSGRLGGRAGGRARLAGRNAFAEYTKLQDMLAISEIKHKVVNTKSDKPNRMHELVINK